MNKSLYSNLFLKRLESLLNATLSNEGEASIQCRMQLRYFTDLINLRLRNRGKEDTVKYFKKVHHIAVCIAMERAFEPISWTKSNKKGWPTLLGPIIPLLIGTNVQKRVGLTITGLYKSIKLKPSTDYESITHNWDLSSIKWIDDFSSYSEKWGKKFPRPILRDRNWLWHETTKVGPNGHALVHCHKDFISLLPDEIWNSICEWVSITAVFPLQDFKRQIMDIWKDIDKKSGNNKHGLSHSRIGVIPEFGGKTRQVAIVDYFTQESMIPLFRWSMKCLRSLETDGTYDQRNVVKRTISYMERGFPIHCLDLSNATDRFPVLLQEIFLSHIIGKDLACIWRKIISDREFITPDGKIVRYAVGQPMGILSSWSIFALTHHLIIEYAAKSIGIKSFRDYSVLGDDVVIYNTEVSGKYQELMSDLGVEISKPKSFHWVPGDTHPPSGEVAKRLLYKCEEITPIPYKLIHSWTKNPHLEALALRDGLTGIGLNFQTSTWETLSLSVPKRNRSDFLIMVTSPLDLKKSEDGVRAELNPVTDGPWSKLDLSLVKDMMAKVIIHDLEHKKEKIWEVHSRVYENTFWDNFIDRQGESLSRETLGLERYPNMLAIHPAVVIINNKVNSLWDLDEKISLLEQDPNNAFEIWGLALKEDFQFASDFTDGKRKKFFKQAKLLKSLYKDLSRASLEEPGGVNPG